MRFTISGRLRLTLLLLPILFIGTNALLLAQEEGDTPLGDVARSFRKTSAAAGGVIDNDNLSKVVDDAESRRMAGLAPVFSLDPVAKKVQVAAPDVTCSLSFIAKSNPQSDQILLDDLPRTELAKLDGPATIDGDSLQVTMHNGTSWEVREVVIGLTIVNRRDGAGIASHPGQARFVPAATDGGERAAESYQRDPDVTLLLRVKGSAVPASTATFRTTLNFALFPEQEWHWAIVKAKGIPPQTPVELNLTTTEMSEGQSPPGPSPLQNVPEPRTSVSPPQSKTGPESK